VSYLKGIGIKFWVLAMVFPFFARFFIFRSAWFLFYQKDDLKYRFDWL
jgi:hypothetical protein